MIAPAGPGASWSWSGWPSTWDAWLLQGPLGPKGWSSVPDTIPWGHSREKARSLPLKNRPWEGIHHLFIQPTFIKCPLCQAQGTGENVVKGRDVVPGLQECTAKRRG